MSPTEGIGCWLRVPDVARSGSHGAAVVGAGGDARLGVRWDDNVLAQGKGENGWVAF
jgi:hypothetical protein